MGKHDTIKQNLKAVSGETALNAAISGWRVARLINNKSESVSCELCGTRFRTGAWIVRRNPSCEISIGWRCLEFIRARRISDANLQRSRTQTSSALKHLYQSLVDPGAWITWIIDHAPPRLAEDAVDLKLFHGARSASALRRLIRFHDNTRRYPIEALFGFEWLMRRGVGGRRYMTLSQARQLDRDKRRTLIERLFRSQAEGIIDTAITPSIEKDPDALRATEALSELGKIALATLCALDIRRENDDISICDEEIFRLWPEIETSVLSERFPEMWVWNPRAGVGILDYRDLTSSETARIWLWAHGGGRGFDIRYWRCVEPASDTATKRLHADIAGKGPAWLLKRR